MKMRTVLTGWVLLGGLTGLAAPLTAFASKMNDSEIANMVMTLNTGEIESGRVATRRAQNKDLRAYADRMVGRHETNSTALESLSQLKGLDPQKTDQSEALKARLNARTKELEAKSRAAFDKAYVDQQVRSHEDALAMIKEDWLPQASNPEFRAFLERTRDRTARQLEEIRRLQANLR